MSYWTNRTGKEITLLINYFYLIKNITFDWIESVIEWLGQSIKHIPCSRILREA